MINKDLTGTPSELVSLTKIPQFRIVGSKYNILQRIYEVMVKENISGNTFFDVFSGSAVVARFFKRKFKIISNDNLYFSYILQRALVDLNSYPLFENLTLKPCSKIPNERIEMILDFLNAAEGIEGFVYLNYTPASKETIGIERKYFSRENGLKIDAIRLKIEEWFHEKRITDEEYFYLLGSLLLAVQKVANTSGTYGAFNKFWDQRSHKALKLKFVEVIASDFNHLAYKENIFDLLDKVSCDIAYIDPPYNSRQYIDNYHILETIAKYDNPEIRGITGIRKNRENEKSIFCNKGSVNNALFELFSRLKTKYIMLSYNSEGLIQKEEILHILRDAKVNNAKLYEFPYRRFKSNGHTESREILEYIFTGVK